MLASSHIWYAKHNRILNHVNEYSMKTRLALADLSFTTYRTPCFRHTLLTRYTRVALCLREVYNRQIFFSGECGPWQAGIRFGKTSYKYAQLQVHWTNEGKATDWYDSSGLRLFYTPKLRQYDLGTIITGQVHLELPPGQSKVC